jgi:hypothetical protein
MEQDSCRRNWFLEEGLNSSRHVVPSAAATIPVGAVTTEKGRSFLPAREELMAGIIPASSKGMKPALSGMEMKGTNAKISTAQNGGPAA